MPATPDERSTKRRPARGGQQILPTQDQILSTVGLVISRCYQDRLRDLLNCSGFTEATGIHGGGQRLHVGVPGQSTVERIQRLRSSQELPRRTPVPPQRVARAGPHSAHQGRLQRCEGLIMQRVQEAATPTLGHPCYSLPRRPRSVG